MLVIEMFFLWGQYWLFLLLGVLSLYLARKRPGLSYGDAFMVLVAAVAGTCAGVAALHLIPAKLDESSFLYTLPLGFELPFMVFAALVLAALRAWKKRSGLRDFLLLLGCLLPLGRIALFVFMFFFAAFSGEF